MTKERISKRKNLLNEPKEVQRRIERGTKAERFSLIRSILENIGETVESLSDDIEFNINEMNLPTARNIAILSVVDELNRMKRIDHREHWLMRQYMADLGFEIVHLNTGEGDVASNKVSIERKDDDLLPSLFDQRRLRQLSAMREEAEHSFVVVTKSWDEIKTQAAQKGMSIRTLIGYMASLCAVGYPPVFMDDKYDAALLMERIVDKIEDDHHRLFVARPKKSHPDNYRNALIEGLPKIGQKTRRHLVEKFGSLAGLANATIEDLMSVDGIGKATAERIHSVFHTGDLE
tara:strand:- start:764 stop:1633 length:870 start_codon:yes stop_codon:yes gene_type:complete